MSTCAENGENLQILHYEPTQEFKEHHDYFDPATDPPENFEVPERMKFVCGGGGSH